MTLRNRAEFGTGGPNQEAAIAAALQLGRARSVAAAFIDTDGSDGGTDAAGAIVDGTTVARARELGIDLREALLGTARRARSRALGDLVETGPTGTNVNDLFAIAVEEARSA